MSDSSATQDSGFVAYEYATIRVDRELESLYQDAYRNFGWTVEGYGPSLPNASTVTLKLKRDRRIKNRSVVQELQRTCEKALASISTLERAKGTAAVSTALAVGIVGSAFIAGSVFAFDADLMFLSIPLGAIGLLGWGAGYLSFGWVKARKTAELTPLIDHQYDIVYETGEQASQLLA